jgi:hypothetical protein
MHDDGCGGTLEVDAMLAEVDAMLAVLEETLGVELETAPHCSTDSTVTSSNTYSMPTAALASVIIQNMKFCCPGGMATGPVLYCVQTLSPRIAWLSPYWMSSTARKRVPSLPPPLRARIQIAMSTKVLAGNWSW